MSLKTWKAEFYPVAAEDVPKDEAVAASLLKYQGARPENLKRHRIGKLGFSPEIVTARAGRRFVFGHTTCPLCLQYSNRAACPNCPLAAAARAARKGHPCWGRGSPYGHWRDTGDPEPMIRLLEAALKGESP